MARIIPFANEAAIELLKIFQAVLGLQELLRKLESTNLAYLMVFVDCLDNSNMRLLAAEVSKHVSTIAEALPFHAKSSAAYMVGNTARILHDHGYTSEAETMAAMCVSLSLASQAEKHLFELLDHGITPSFVFLGYLTQLLGTTIIIENLEQMRSKYSMRDARIKNAISLICSFEFVSAASLVAQEHIKRLWNSGQYQTYTIQILRINIKGLSDSDTEYSSAGDAYLAYQKSLKILSLLSEDNSNRVANVDVLPENNRVLTSNSNSTKQNIKYFNIKRIGYEYNLERPRLESPGILNHDLQIHLNIAIPDN